jgi:hypothetical protein
MGGKKTMGEGVLKRRLNQKQYEMLKSCSDKGDMTEWNEWRKANPTIPILLEGVDLKGANLRGANLRGAILIMTDLEGANLRRGDLRGADLRGAILTRADLRETELRSSNLTETLLMDSNLDGANVEEWNLKRAKSDGARIDGVNLIDTNGVEKNNLSQVVKPERKAAPVSDKCNLSEIEPTDEGKKLTFDSRSDFHDKQTEKIIKNRPLRK